MNTSRPSNISKKPIRILLEGVAEERVIKIWDLLVEVCHPFDGRDLPFSDGSSSGSEGSIKTWRINVRIDSEIGYPGPKVFQENRGGRRWGRHIEMDRIMERAVRGRGG